LKCIGVVNTYRLTKKSLPRPDRSTKKFATPTLTCIMLKPAYRPHNHILRSW